MILAWLLLLTGLTISSVAIYYSVVGLTAIFSAAAVPIMIMGVSLEVAKLVCATWIKQYWTQVPRLMKTYMVTAVVLLMLITSMGIFGFLSKAHNDQNLVSGDVQSKIAIYDEKIRTARDNIEANRKALKQMDEAVDQVMGRSTDEKGADKAVAIRNGQKRDRAAIAKDIEANQRIIATLNDEAAPIRAEVRKVEAEVGPIKYIAAFLYGVTPDAGMLEKAVTWIIITIVVVFDPLAVIMLLAAQMTFAWRRAEGGWVHDKDGTIVGVTPGTKITDDEAAMDISAEDIPGVTTRPFTQAEIDALNKPIVDEAITVEKYAENNPPINESIISTEPTIQELDSNVGKKPIVDEIQEPPVAAEPQFEGIRTPGSDEWVQTGPVFDAPNLRAAEASPGRNRGVMYSQPVQADNTPSLGKASNSDFGNQYPDNPEKGDVYLRTDFLPNRLFKYNGNKWIEVDKNQTDVYAYEEQYIKYLIEQIEQGKYDAETLTAVEREQIAQYIGKNA